MADLPKDRLETGPPFIFVGIDVFGPWPIVFRKIRGMQRNYNRWAILFTCFVSPAVHDELLKELKSCSFNNALHRSVAFQESVQQCMSDRGTYFVGGMKELNLDVHLIERDLVATYLQTKKDFLDL
jgi:hypothetical protein